MHLPWCDLSIIFCYPDRGKRSKTAMARLALQNWGARRIRHFDKLRAKVAQGHKMAWPLQACLSLEGWYANKVGPDILDSQPVTQGAKRWSYPLGFWWRRHWKLACPGTKKLTIPYYYEKLMLPVDNSANALLESDLWTFLSDNISDPICIIHSKDKTPIWAENLYWILMCLFDLE